MSPLKKTNLALVVAIAAASASLVLGSSAAEATTTQPSPNSSIAAKPELTRVNLPLAHPLSLADSIKASHEINEKVVSFAFDNGKVAGEFSPGQGTPLAEYLQEFRLAYGTQPMVNALVVERPLEEAKSEARQAAALPATLGAGLPAYVAPSVVLGGRPAAMAAKDASLIAAHRSARAAAPAVTFASQEWRPYYTDISVLGGSGLSPFFWESYYWQNFENNNLPKDKGLEFEINEDNPNVFAPQNTRPFFCGDPNYKEQFWVANHNYNWSVVDVSGSSAGSLGAYADYNDASDLCRTNSIAIGLEYPQRITDDSYGSSGIYVQIEPPRGLKSSSAYSGNVQAVTSGYCTGGIALTDCMGVQDITQQWTGYPAGVYNRTTANTSHGTIPSKCWSTDLYGLSYTAFSCTGMDG